jgi:hypothetical protein
VVDQIRTLVQTPEIVARTWRKVRECDREISARQVHEALRQFDDLWNELFPAEQARIVQLLVERVTIDVAGVDIRLRTEGLASLLSDLRKPAAHDEQPAAQTQKIDRGQKAA